MQMQMENKSREVSAYFRDCVIYMYIFLICERFNQLFMMRGSDWRYRDVVVKVSSFAIRCIVWMLAEERMT